MCVYIYISLRNRFFPYKTQSSSKKQTLIKVLGKIPATTTMSMATKVGRVVTYHEGLPPTKSHDPLIKWPCEITY